ncbi:MAG TPA: relaxase domain-containing protein [Falsiroseomonas sp.]|nr:relaxase domain-containing protein [Falsiroseomonas sp.]
MADHLLQPTEPAEERNRAAEMTRELPGGEHEGTVPRVRRDLPPEVGEALALDPRRTPTREDVVNLAAGRRADGTEARKLRIRSYERQDGKLHAGVDFLDITLSTETSWGIARWNSATPEGRAILDAVVHRAADDAMAFAERELGFTRRGAGGRGGEEPGSIGWVRFTHHTARPTKDHPASPDWHMQHLIPNAVVTGRGHVGAMNLRRMTGFVHVLGAYFHARLATRGREAGMRVELDPRTGSAVLSDIPQSLREELGRRTREAEAEAKAYARRRGLDWDTLSAKRRTRLLKVGARRTQASGRDGMAELENWRAVFARHGLRPMDVAGQVKRPQIMPLEARAEVAYRQARTWLEEAFARHPSLPAPQVRLYAVRAMISTGIRELAEADRVIAHFTERGIRGPDGQPMALVFGVNPARNGARFVKMAEREGEQSAPPPRADAPARPEAAPLLKQAAAVRAEAVQGLAVAAWVREGVHAATRHALAARAWMASERGQMLLARARTAKAAAVAVMRMTQAGRMGERAGRAARPVVIGAWRALVVGWNVGRVIATHLPQMRRGLAAPPPAAATLPPPDPATALTRQAVAVRDASVTLKRDVRAAMREEGGERAERLRAMRALHFGAAYAAQREAGRATQAPRTPVEALRAQREAEWRERDEADKLAIRDGLRASAESAAEALLGKPDARSAAEWRWGRKGSLALELRSPKRGIWHDHEAGEGGDLLALAQRQQGSFPAAVAWARSFLGMPEVARGPVTEAERARAAELAQAAAERERRAAAEQARAEAARIALARQTARDSIPVAGTVAERYLTETRGIPKPAGGWPEVVRFDAKRTALVVVAKGADGEVSAVQLVRLTPEGRKIALGTKRVSRGREVELLVKQTYGVTDGAGVDLPGRGVRVVAEGPETGLSIWSATGRPVTIALGGVGKLGAPREPVVIAADDDALGSAGAKALERAVGRWREAGTAVAVVYPWRERRLDKSDFNDAIREGGPEAVHRALRFLSPTKLPEPAPAAKPAGRGRDDESSMLEGDRNVRQAKADLRRRQIQHWKEKAEVGRQAREAAAPKTAVTARDAEGKRPRMAP